MFDMKDYVPTPYSVLIKFREALQLPNLRYNTDINRRFLDYRFQKKGEVYCESFLTFGRNPNYDFTLLGGKLEDDDECVLKFLDSLQIVRLGLMRLLRTYPAVIYATHGFEYNKMHPVDDEMFKLYQAEEVKFDISFLN